MKSLILIATLFLSDSNVQAKSLEVLNNPVKQGGTVVVRINPQWQGPLVCVLVFGEQYVPNKYGYVHIGVSLYEKQGKKALRFVECGRGVILDQYHGEIVILKNSFPKTRTAGIDGGKSKRPRKSWERKAISSAFSGINQSVGDLTEGIVPLYPLEYIDVIDPFGLIYVGNNKLPHYGVDLRASVGTSVRSVNGGQVVLVAEDYSKEGNMIIVNHGLGIFSVYMHLSKIYLRNGDIVKRGQIVGLSGETGTGVREPHLHFNIKIKNTYVDPLEFIKTTNENLNR